MLTPAPSAASSLIAAPASSATGATAMSARFGAAPTGTFAALLNQVGQPVTPSTSADVASADGNGAATTGAALPDQPSPVTLPLATASPLPSAPLAAEPRGSNGPALADNLLKTADPKARTSKAPDDSSDSPVAASDPTLPIPLPEPTPLATVIPTTSSVPSGIATPVTTAEDPAKTADSAATPPDATSASVAPTPPPAPPGDPSTTTILAPATLLTSRSADRATAAQTKPSAKLSIDDDEHEDAQLPAPQLAAGSTTDSADHLPTAMPAAAPQLAAPQLEAIVAPAPSATPAASAALGQQLRVGPDTLSRTAELDASSPASGPSITEPTQTQPAFTQPVTTMNADAQAVSPVTASMIAASSNPARPAPAAPSPPPPAIQVAQAITEPVKLVLSSPVQTGPSTPHVTTIQIAPAELGRVDVRIERTGDGPAKIQLIAERPETLSRLIHDQSQLQLAMDHVGIPQTSRTIEFSLAAPPSDTSAFSSNQSGNNTSNGNAPNQGSPRQNSAYYNQSFKDADDTLTTTTQSRTIRAGIDITA